MNFTAQGGAWLPKANESKHFTELEITTLFFNQEDKNNPFIKDSLKSYENDEQITLLKRQLQNTRREASKKNLQNRIADLEYEKHIRYYKLYHFNYLLEYGISDARSIFGKIYLDKKRDYIKNYLDNIIIAGGFKFLLYEDSKNIISTKFAYNIMMEAMRPKPFNSKHFLEGGLMFGRASNWSSKVKNINNLEASLHYSLNDKKSHFLYLEITEAVEITKKYLFMLQNYYILKPWSNNLFYGTHGFKISGAFSMNNFVRIHGGYSIEKSFYKFKTISNGFTISLEVKI